MRNLEAGGAGIISSAANLSCAASREVFEAFEAGDRQEAEAGMKLVTAVRKALAARPLVPAIKHVIAAGHHDSVWENIRAPLVALDPESGAELIRDLDAAGFAYDPDLYTVAGA